MKINTLFLTAQMHTDDSYRKGVVYVVRAHQNINQYKKTMSRSWIFLKKVKI